MTPYATSQTSDHNRRFYVWATSSTYDEVALTKEEKKKPKELIQYQEKKPPIHNQELKPPRIFSAELLPVQQGTLPYSSPDWNKILADKESAQGFQILVQKHNNRWLCLPSKASIRVRQEEQIKVKQK